MWQKFFVSKNIYRFAVLAVLLLSFVLRTTGLNWDQGQHLHPDERFLTMVTNAMKAPTNIKEYLNSAISPLNPPNIGYDFFVYGILPLTVNKYIALKTGLDDYGNVTLLGRLLSGIYDTIAVALVAYLAYLIFEKNKNAKSISILAALCYGVSVLPIQLSHFYTTDIMGSMFSLAAFVLAYKYYKNKRPVFLFATSVLAGLALACKVSAIFALMPSVLLVVVTSIGQLKTSSFKNKSKTLVILGLAGLVGFLVLRMANPYYFESPKILSIQLNKKFAENIKKLKLGEGFDIWMPPATQWMTKSHEVEYGCKEVAKCTLSIRYYKWEKDMKFDLGPTLSGICKSVCRYRIYPSFFAIKNLLLFGIGPILTIFFVIGLWRFFVFADKDFASLMFLLSVLLPVAYFSFQFVASMRYLLSVYPFVAIICAVGVVDVIDKVFQRTTVKKAKIISVVVIIALVSYANAFVNIYKTLHTRIQASRFIYATIANRAVIAGEHWDDGLPVGQDAKISQGKTYEGKQLEVFYEDSPAKWEKINSTLASSDYYILSSNRGWGTMMNFAKRYPLQAVFYRDLFAGRSNYELIAKFVSYPRFCLWKDLCYDYVDNNAEEAFSVYDHPEVYIFKNSKK